MKAPPGAAGAILLFSLGIGEFLFPLFPEEAADLVPKGRGHLPYLLPEHPPAREEGGFRPLLLFPEEGKLGIGEDRDRAEEPLHHMEVGGRGGFPLKKPLEEEGEEIEDEVNPSLAPEEEASEALAHNPTPDEVE